MSPRIKVCVCVGAGNIERPVTAPVVRPAQVNNCREACVTLCALASFFPSFFLLRRDETPTVPAARAARRFPKKKMARFNPFSVLGSMLEVV